MGQTCQTQSCMCPNDKGDGTMPESFGVPAPGPEDTIAAAQVVNLTSAPAAALAAEYSVPGEEEEDEAARAAAKAAQVEDAAPALMSQPVPEPQAEDSTKTGDEPDTGRHSDRQGNEEEQKLTVWDMPEEERVGRVKSYDITLTKPTSDVKLGMTPFKANDGTHLLRVGGIRPDGLVAQWNTDNPEDAVQLNDRIVGVNGVSGNMEKMVEIMSTEMTIVLRLVRLTPHFAMVLERPSPSVMWGLKFKPSDCILAAVPTSGQALEWNQQQLAEGRPEIMVKLGDRIDAVNGVEGSGEILVAELQKPDLQVLVRVARKADKAAVPQ